MNHRHRKILEDIFAKPTKADVSWPDIESLFLALGAEIEEGRGSRVRIAMGGVRSVFHRPHPKHIAGKAMVDSVRDFLVLAGVKP